jgi:hyperosmotically inducible periplasmic protein
MNVIPVVLCFSTLLLASGCDRPVEATPPPAPVSVGTGIDDSILTTRVKSALLGEPDMKSFDIKVETRSGEVMLSGFVASQGQVERALTVARGVEGVKSVLNKMDLKEGAASIGNTVDDSLITAKVKSALLADPGIKSLDIAVVTRKGEAQLSGFVDSQNQIDQAGAIARGVPGVVSVSSEMSIKK